MKEKMRKAIPYLITAAVAFCAAILLVALLLRPQSLVIGTTDLSYPGGSVKVSVRDGHMAGYALIIGTFKNDPFFGIVKKSFWIFKMVKVEIKGHEITGIEVIAHKPSYMKQAEQIAGAVCAAQSLEVDAISGATLTSDTVLKAIENALEDGNARP